MRPDKNYKVYREALRSVTPPCVPFLGTHFIAGTRLRLTVGTGVYLTDWTFIGDGNPDMLREKPHQINFNKRQKASELILMIQLNQSITYNLSAVPAISQWLDQQLFPSGRSVPTDEHKLYDLSLTREPRERDDEKIARLLSESGFL
jgi:son of sevenless-like protein